MVPKTVQLLRVCLGAVLILLGFLGAGVGILAILDPVRTKMSADGDPLGVPPSLAESLTLTLVYALILLLGCWLFCRSSWIRNGTFDKGENLKLK